MNTRSLLVGIICLAALVVPTQSQNKDGSTAQEQSSFSTEEIPGTSLIKRPVPVPNAVLQALSEDVDVRGCLRDIPLPRGHSLASLFIGSEIHLDGPSESDLVIVPVPDYGCFHSAAGIGIFWIFRETGDQYKLALKTLGNGLSILKTRYNGYRIIQTGTIGEAGKVFTMITFRFDGKLYQKYKESTEQQQ